LIRAAGACLVGFGLLAGGPLGAFEVPEMDTQKFPIEVYGDYLEYRTKANQVVTKGNAFIAYKDLKIRADTVQANTKNEDIFAQGQVEFWKGYDQTTGDLMVYNMKTGKGWMREAMVRRNRNFFKAKEAYLSPAYSKATDIVQSTCDRVDCPHYKIRAGSVEMVPGHHMTMEDLKFRWRGKTLYSRGMDRSSLVKKEAKLFNTRQGSSAIDGFYFKFMSDLVVNEAIRGDFTYDYFQKRGYGFGFNGSYTGKGQSNGTLSLYNLQETIRNHTNLQLNLTHNYRFQRYGSLSTSVAYTGDKTGETPENQDMNVQMNYSTQLKFAGVNITASKFIDVDGSKYTFDDGYQVLNRIPEVNLTFPAMTMPLLPISMNMTGMFGKYEERQADKSIKTTEKKDLRSAFSSPTVKVNRRFDFTPTYNYEKNWYSDGFTRESGNTMVRAAHRFSKSTNAEFNYNLATQKGNSPFRFDSSTQLDMFSTRVRIAEGPWTLNPINFNYDRKLQQLQQIYWDYSLRSLPTAYHNWEFFLRRDYTAPPDISFTRFNLTTLRPGNMNMRYRFASNLWSFDTSMTWPHEYGRVTNTSMNYRITIRPLWQINTNGNYNHLTRKFSPLTLGLIRDLHCWEARAEYNLERKEFWVEFYLKAYPEDAGRFRYGADTNRLEAKFAAWDQMTQKYDSYKPR